MGRLILVRHGKSELNKDNIFFGQLDPDLTKKGKSQANNTKEIMRKVNYTKIYSSPLKRALNTANIINVKDLNIELQDELQELNFGIFEGLTYDEILKIYPVEAKKWETSWKTYNYEVGESVKELQKRVISFIDTLDLGNEDIVLVTHWGVINCILSHYFSGELNGYWKYAPNYAGVSIIEFENNFPILRGFNIGEKNENI
jgi:alpha-ribazole phosphatase